MASKKTRPAVQMCTAIDGTLLKKLHKQVDKERRTIRAVIEQALTEYFPRHHK